MGRHHGIDGSREFSNPRGMFELGAESSIAPLLSPHGEATRQFVQHATGGLLG